MPLDPRKLFLFNSGLPEANQSALDFSRMLGPWQSNFRGRNNGNGYITHATLKSLFGKALRLDHVANGWTADLSDDFVARINENYSHLIFTMQDFINPSFAVQAFGRLADFLEKVQIPVVPISLGANSFPEDLQLHEKLSADQIRFLKVLSERSVSIGVRGAYSQTVLERLGITNVTITGCPSFFENGAGFRVARGDYNEMGVITTGSFFSRGLRHSPHLLQDEMFFIHALYLKQDERVRLDESSEAEPYNPANLDATFQLYERAMTGRLRFFSDFDAWRRYYQSGSWCLTIGTRLHSAIQSWNSGVPAIVTNGDARARETCETHGIPYLPFLNSVSDLREAYEAIDVNCVAARYDDGCKTFLDYMAAHGIVPSNYETSMETFMYPDYPLLNDETSRAILRQGFCETWDYVHGFLREYEILQAALNDSTQNQIALSTTISALQTELMSNKAAHLEANTNLNALVTGLVQKDDAAASRFEAVSGQLSALDRGLADRLDDLRELSGISFVNLSERLAALEAGLHYRESQEQLDRKLNAVTTTINNILVTARQKGLIAERFEFDSAMSVDAISASGRKVMDALKHRLLL